MGLFTVALAFGAGYTLGKPGGREQVMSYLQQAREQARNPPAEQVLDRGRRLLAHRLRVAAQRADPGRGASTPAAAPDTGPVGFGETTVAEDSDAVLLGMRTPSPTLRPRTPGSPPAGS